MSDAVIIFFLFLCIAVLILVVIYQQFLFRKGIQKNLQEMCLKLKEILDDHESQEKVMVFTDNRGLIELMSQINRLLEEHHKVRADFRRSEMSSKKMLSNISHDIKTPMTVILGYLEIMRIRKSKVQENEEMLSLRTSKNADNADNPDPDMEILLKVEQKASKVMELINQFFTLAKLEAGDTNIRLFKVNINECCRENVLDFYGLLMQKEFQVDIEIPEETLFVQGDQDALQRILFNLISNALRYGAEGKYLGVFIRSDEKFVYIDISDKGKGIEKEFSRTIFERLFTMEDSRNREIQGNGLGLAIARNLAVQLGGDILLESQPYVLTTFTLKLNRFLF